MKYVSKVLISGLLGCGTGYFSTSVVADELTFTPRASISIASYEFTQSPRPGALAPTGINNNDFPEVKFDVTFKILGVGATIFKNGFYLDLMIQKSLEEEDSFSMSDPNLPLPGNTFSENFKGDRQDTSLTIGRKILDNRGAIYAGYKTGKSEADGDQGQHLSFEEDGFFIGTNYAWIIPDSGVFSINLAFADLNGDLREDVTNPAFASPAVLAVPLDTNASSDAQGLSYGIAWSSRISDSLSYSLSLDAKSYTFDNVTDANPDAIPSSEFKETFISTSLSIFFLFN